MRHTAAAAGAARNESETQLKTAKLLKYHAVLYVVVTFMIMPLVLINPTPFTHFTVAVMAVAAISHFKAADMVETVENT